MFSTYQIKAENYYINTSFNNNEFSKFVEKIKNRSNYDYKEDVKNTEQIITLSSCVTGGVDRIVLHAKLINEE